MRDIDWKFLYIDILTYNAGKVKIRNGLTDAIFCNWYPLPTIDDFKAEYSTSFKYKIIIKYLLNLWY